MSFDKQASRGPWSSKQSPHGSYQFERLTPYRDEKDPGVCVTKDGLKQFLESFRRRGISDRTLRIYEQKLNTLYDFLPEDKTIHFGTLKHWQSTLIEKKYANASVNTFLTVANMYLDFIGRREYQLPEQLRRESKKNPELSREEYLRMLEAARKLRKERAYLLIKLFGGVGFSAAEVHEITVEAVKLGKITLASNRTERTIRFPKILRGELLSFAERKEIESGRIFCAKNGSPLNRGTYTRMFSRVCEEARVEENKGTPRCLQQLYQSTRVKIENDFRSLVDQTYNRLLEEEQLRIGWENA